MASRLPLGLVRHELADMPEGVAQQLYERDQILWLRLPEPQRRRCRNWNFDGLRAQFRREPEFFSSHWSVENAVRHDRTALSPETIFGSDCGGGGGASSSSSSSSSSSLLQSAWYVSCILQDDKPALATFLATTPFAVPADTMLDAEHDDGVWLFVGCNPEQSASQHNDRGVNGPPHTKKRKGKKGATVSTGQESAAATAPIEGRPEHTDDVDHSGTWHVQLRGNKTWLVRPQEEAAEWAGEPPALDRKSGAERRASGGWRLRIDVRKRGHASKKFPRHAARLAGT